MQNSLFILGQLSDEDVEWMLASGSRQQLAPGTVLIWEGQPINALYIVLEGTLSVVLSLLDGKEVNRAGPGDILGELSFVDARPPSATVRAVDTAIVFGIDRKQLDSKLEHDPLFAARFYRALAIFLSDRLRHTLGLLQQRTQSDAQQALIDDELDPNVLDTVHLAGARLRHILHRLQAG